uniref:Uncharacterized protein n=1 Tax=Arundo donax TaxID=35708 RepID=A0A0A9HLH4_ARUDO
METQRRLCIQWSIAKHSCNLAKDWRRVISVVYGRSQISPGDAHPGRGSRLLAVFMGVGRFSFFCLLESTFKFVR